MFDELENDNDEVLYLDFDVIPIKNSIIFDVKNIFNDKKLIDETL